MRIRTNQNAQGGATTLPKEKTNCFSFNSPHAVVSINESPMQFVNKCGFYMLLKSLTEKRQTAAMIFKNCPTL